MDSMHNPAKPIIGVTGPVKADKILWWCTKFAIWMAGGKAIRITTQTKSNIPQCDGFVISGGSDIHPQRYGELADNNGSQYDIPRDEMESEIIHRCIEKDIPMLGICRGMQMINVALGGSLYQDAQSILEDFLPNKSLFSKFFFFLNVTIDDQSLLHEILGKYDEYLVNSIHHQAVRDLAHKLKIVAREKNNLVQAVEPKEANALRFLIAVQWHPELMLHAKSARNLFKGLVDSARAKY